MAFCWKCQPSWAHEVDIESDDFESGQESRLTELKALMEFMSQHESEVTYPMLEEMVALMVPVTTEQWTFGTYPEVMVVQEMYERHRNWPFGHHPFTTNRITAEEFFDGYTRRVNADDDMCGSVPLIFEVTPTEEEWVVAHPVLSICHPAIKPDYGF